MQFSPFSIGIFSIIIINPVCNIRSLLYLSNKYPFPDRMNSSCRQEKYVSTLNRMELKDIHNRIIFYPFDIFIRSNLLRKTWIQPSSFLCRNNIPHFCFTKWIMALFSQLIIRMNLNRQIIPSIDKLNQ